MYLPKKDILTALKSVTLGGSNPQAIYVAQGSQAVFAQVPAITFRADDNNVSLDLDNQIASQAITAVVDIWADDSPTASDILSGVEEKMRGIGYRLSFSMDVPSPEGSLYHITTRFETVR